MKKCGGWKLSEETKERVRQARLGKKHSQETKDKIRKTLQRPRPEFSGDKHPNWQGGKTEARRRHMSTFEYKDWRRKVFERDEYTCVICGDNTSGNLQADHIKPYANYPELRLDVDNGRTLCVPCHEETDTFLRIK